MPKIDGLPTPTIRRVRVPSAATLRTYGLTRQDFDLLLAAQGEGCAVCGKVPDNGRLCIDHEHVKGWKKMPAEQRKRYTRGLLCFFCNHYYVGRAITVAKAQAVLTYLQRYQARRESHADGH